MPEHVSPYSLAGQLEKFPTRVLAAFADRIGLGVAGTEDAAGLRAAITAFLSDPQGVLARMKALPEANLRVLAAAAIAGDGRTGPVIPRKTATKEEAALLQICQDLSERGWLFPDPGAAYSGDGGYIIVHDLLPLYAEAATQALSRDERPYYHPWPADSQWAGPEILSAMVRVLGAIAREPVKVTQQGSVYRRDIERLRKVRGKVQFTSASPAWGRIERFFGSDADQWREAPWQEEGRDVGMLLWLGLALDLLEEAHGTLRTKPDWVAVLAASGRTALWESVSISLATMLINKETSALMALRTLFEESGFAPLPWLEDVFRARLRVPGVDARRAAAACLLTLGEIGLVEAALAGAQPILRLSPAGAWIAKHQPPPTLPIEETFRVLESGDVLVTAYLAPAVQATLERYATPARVDVVTTYRIEQRLLVRAAGEGASAEEILGFFDAHAADGVPQAVRFRLAEWLQDIGRVEFLEAALIACDDTRMRDRVLSLPAVHKEVLESLGDRWLIIPADAEERLRTAMEQAGIVPLTQVRRPSGLSTERERRRRKIAGVAQLGRLSWGTQTYGQRLDLEDL